MQAIRNRFNSVMLVLIALMLAGALARGVLGGPLDPPSPPGSTLPQVEPRMPIPPVGWDGTFPIAITQPGSYFLTQNLTGVADKMGIVITRSHVTLDLNGFVLAGVPGSQIGVADCDAISMWCGDYPPQDLEVRNGTISGWGMAGISSEHTSGGVFKDLRLANNAGGGIRTGGNDLVMNVTADGNGQNGILLYSMISEFQIGGIVRDSTARNNAIDGIQVLGQALVLNNDSYSNGGAGVRLYHSNNRVDSNNVANNGAGGVVASSGSTANVIVRNSARANTGGNYLDASGSNDFGPAGIASTVTSPWANISH